MDDLTKEFEQWLTEEGRASKTVESYVGDIKGYHFYMKEKAVNGKRKIIPTYIIDGDQVMI